MAKPTGQAWAQLFLQWEVRRWQGSPTWPGWAWDYNWVRGHWSIRRLVLLALSCDLSTPGMNMEGLVKHPPVTGKEPAQRLCLLPPRTLQ